VIDEYAPHHLGRDAEEVCTILPLHVVLIHQSHIRLMNEGGRLQRVSWLFSTQITRGLPAQFIVDQRHQFIERFLIFRHLVSIEEFHAKAQRQTQSGKEITNHLRGFASSLCAFA